MGNDAARQHLLGQPVDRVFQPLADVIVDMNTAVVFHPHLLVGGVDAGQDVPRAQGGQHRLQAVLQRQQMRRTAARGDRQHDLARQRLFIQKVQHGLQAAGERRLVHRR
ncbi:hypothetical protein G6F68_021072 [Rhizopus microsporus]|nr:hypothetical protein G6F68_021072 [Rhizopus microsporus]